MKNKATISAAVWLYAGMTRGFITGELTPGEYARLREEGPATMARRHPDVEVHVDTIDSALVRWWDESTPDQRALGVDVDTLHDYFGHQWCLRDVDLGTMLGAIETVSRADLGIPTMNEAVADAVANGRPIPGVMSMRLGNGVATLCRAIVEHLDYCERLIRIGRDGSDLRTVGPMRERAEDLYALAGGIEPDGAKALDQLPAALAPTVKKWLGNIELRDLIVKQVEP